MMATSMPSTATIRKHSKTNTHWVLESARPLMNSRTLMVVLWAVAGVSWVRKKVSSG